MNPYTEPQTILLALAIAAGITLCLLIRRQCRKHH